MKQTEIIEIFEDILQIKKGKINLSSKPEDIEEWDSVATINIIVAIEEQMGVKFKLKDLDKANSVEDFLKLVNFYKNAS